MVDRIIDRADQYLTHYSLYCQSKQRNRQRKQFYILLSINCALLKTYQVYTKNSKNRVRYKQFLP